MQVTREKEENRKRIQEEQERQAKAAGAGAVAFAAGELSEEEAGVCDLTCREGGGVLPLMRLS